MSTLIITYNKLNDATGAAKNLSKKIDKRAEDYEGIKKKVKKISTNRNNLSQANYFIQKKQMLLGEKREKIDKFKQRIDDFKEEVQEADKRVARRIKNDTKSFKKANNINVSVFSYIGIALEEMAERWFGKDTVKLFQTFIRNAKYEIKDWYYDEGGKYIVNILVDTVIVIAEATLLVIAIASGVGTIVAGLGLFFAAFSTYKATCTLAYDIKAYKEYNEHGNRVLSDRTDAMGGKEATVQFLGDIMGDENAALLYDTTNLASMIFGLYKMGTATKGIFDSLKNHQLSFGNITASTKYYYHGKGMTDIADFFTNGTDSFGYKALNIYKWYKDGKKVIDIPTGTTGGAIYDSGADIVDNIMSRFDKEPTRITPLPSMSGYRFPSPTLIAV